MVKEKDILSSIANRFSVPLSTITMLNHFDSKVPFQGKGLIIYEEEFKSSEPDREKNKESLP